MRLTCGSGRGPSSSGRGPSRYARGRRWRAAWPCHAPRRHGGGPLAGVEVGHTHNIESTCSRPSFPDAQDLCRHPRLLAGAEQPDSDDGSGIAPAPRVRAYLTAPGRRTSFSKAQIASGLCIVQAIPLPDHMSQAVSLAIDPGEIVIAQLVPVGHEEGFHRLPLDLDFRSVHGTAPGSESLTAGVKGRRRRIDARPWRRPARSTPHQKPRGM